MGKKLIVKGVSFYDNALFRSRTYLLGITDTQLNAADVIWDSNGFGYSIYSQSEIQGKTLHGIRMKVGAIGTTTIYKSATVNPKTSEELTEVATITATKTGLQDIDFSSPIVLAQDEYLVIGAKNKGEKGLAGYASTTRSQLFYYRCGASNTGLALTFLGVNFYTKLT